MLIDKPFQANQTMSTSETHDLGVLSVIVK